MRYLLIFILFQCLFSFGQTTVDPLRHIHFESEFEREQFERFFAKKEANYMELLVASSPNGSEAMVHELQSRIDDFFDENHIAKLSKKTSAKRVKSIYEKIHSELLDKYEAENIFTNVIKDGNYNCVTATALYALVFEKLNIPYTIQERPTHVYALAYPKTEQIIVESTDPVGGFMSFNERYKNTFVQQMTKAKLIGSAESSSKSVDALFNQYYFKDKDVNIVELIGLQYMNQGIYGMNKNSLELALNNFEKAYLFYPDEKIGSTLLVARLQYLGTTNFKKTDDAIILTKLQEHESLAITNEIILNEFQRAMYELLTQNSDWDGAERFYQTVINKITDEELSSDISHYYNYERARLLNNQGDYSASLNFGSEALRLKPKNKDTENLFMASLSQKMRVNSDYKAISKELERISREHEQLMENNIFASMLGNIYLVLFGQSYDFGKINEGDEYHRLFRDIYQPNMNIDQNNVGRAYSIAAVYYFRLGNKSKSLKYIEEGLSIAPGNYELQTRKRMITQH